MNILNKIYMTFMLIMLSSTFIACSDSDEDSQREALLTAPPSIKNFIANIDEGSTAQSLGAVEIVTDGGSNINSFRLEGSGYSNFSISKYGEITTTFSTDLNNTTSARYDLTVIATNDYGDSNRATATIQVNSSTQPLLEEAIVRVDDYYTGVAGNLVFDRDGISGVFDSVNIKAVEILGDIDGGFSISDSGQVLINNSLGSSPTRYDLLVRPININDVVGPYTSLTVYVNDTGYTTYINDPLNSSDDFPDYLDTSTYTSASISNYTSSYNIGGSMNYMSDHDYIKIYIESDNTNVSFSLSTNGIYNNGNGGNYIALYQYDDFNNASYYQSTYSNNYPFTILNAGYYYINVHETSDSYALNIEVQDSGIVQNSARFSRNNEIVYDNNYDLSWQDDYDAQSITKQWLTQVNYDACVADNSSPACNDTSGDTAATYCTDLNLNAYSDWRLPTYTELGNIVEYSNSPTIDATFQNTSFSIYWSNTADAGVSAFTTNFSDGYTGSNNMDNYSYVRCVRDGL